MITACHRNGPRRHHWHSLVCTKLYCWNQCVLYSCGLLSPSCSLVTWLTHAGFHTADVCNGWSDKLYGTTVLMPHDDMFFCKLSHFYSSVLVSSCIILNPVSVLKQYVVSMDGNDPFIKWQLEKGLDRTISSVAGESYRVDVRWTSLFVYMLVNTFKELLFRY